MYLLVPSFYSILGKNNSIVSTCINVTKDKLVPVTTWVDLTFVGKLGSMKGEHYFKVDYNNLMEKVTFLPYKIFMGVCSIFYVSLLSFSPQHHYDQFWAFMSKKCTYTWLVKNLGVEAWG